MHDYQFRDTNYDSFRKIISRLAKQGEITHLGLTLYYNGKFKEEERFEIVENYFIHYRHGFYAGNALLYKLGIIEERPAIIEINCNVERGVTCCGVKAIPFGKLGVGKNLSMPEFYVLCELARIEKQVDDDHYDKLMEIVEKFALFIKDNYALNGKLAFGIEAPFPRYIYFKVANLLRPFDLYNEVIEWYEGVQERETRKNI